MGTINLEDIQPGMVLEREVKDRSGRILLGAGHEISGKHLRIFKMWGVTEAEILNVDKKEVAAKAAAHIDPVRLRDVEDQTRKLFRYTDPQHPFICELFRILTFRAVRQNDRSPQ